LHKGMPVRARPLVRSACVVILAALTALVAPAVAQAHSGSLVVAVDYRVTIRSVPRGLTATVIDGDRKLELRAGPRMTVLVLGYEREPVLRFSTGGVEVNDRSPTAWSDKLARGSGPSFDLRAPPSWRLVTRRHSFAWHEHRLVPTVSVGRAVPWSIPLVVQGRPAAVTGQTRKVSRPALWPWLALGGALLLGSAALLRRKTPRAARLAAFALACTAGAAAFASVVGVTLAGAAGRGVALEIGSASALAAASLAGIVFWRAGRAVVLGAVATLALIEGLGLVSVFVHSIVVSVLPALAARLAAALAVWGSVAALALLLLDGVVWDPRARGARRRAST
jgi:hypothetical protein